MQTFNIRLALGTALLCLYALIAPSQLFAQNIGINTDGSSPVASAILDIKSETMGLLIPRMSSAQRVAIPAPAQGLMVYDLSTASFWFYSSGWTELHSGAIDDGDWTVSGSNLIRMNGNIGIGSNNPLNLLHLRTNGSGAAAAIQFDAQEEPMSSSSSISNSNVGLSIAGSAAAPWTGNSDAASSAGGDEFTGGLVDWSSPEESDILRIRFTFPPGQIPTNATILGYQLSVRLRSSDSDDIVDNLVSLGLGTTPQGDNKARGASYDWPINYQTVNYGNGSDDWATNIPVASINAGQLSAFIQYKEDIPVFGADEQGFIDYVTCRVYFEAPGSPVNSVWAVGNLGGEFLVNDNVDLSISPALKIDSDDVTTLEGLRITSLAAAGKVLTSDATGLASWQLATDIVDDADADPSNELQTVTAGLGLIGGGSSTAITLDAQAGNGLSIISDEIQLGGAMTTNTSIDVNNAVMQFDLLGTLAEFEVFNDGVSVFEVDGVSGVTTFNKTGSAGSDVIMEGDTNSRLFFLDASEDRIGIKEFTPEATLHIKENSVLNEGQLKLSEASPNDGVRMYFDNTSETTHHWMMYARADNYVPDNIFGWYSSAAGDYIVQMKGNRTFGINVDPSYALHLPNDVITGYARANTWSTYSDMRIKTSITPLSSGLEKLMKLQPKTYLQHASSFESGKLAVDSSDGTSKMGFIAQELIEVVPSAVQKPINENEQLWGVDYTALIPLLTKAIQEQQAQIELLNQEIEALKALKQ